MVVLGPTFAREIEIAGLAGLPFVWASDGTITGRDQLTAEQRTLLDSVVGAHNPGAKPPQPVLSATKLGLKRALEEIGRWQEIRTLIEANPSTAEDWSLALEIHRNDPMFVSFVSTGSFTDVEIDAVFRRAIEVVDGLV